MTENNAKKYIIKVRGEEVEVSEEVYRAYIRPIRAEQRRKRREWKCSKLSKTGGYYVRCNERCETCPYYNAGNSALGNVTSLDNLVDCEVEIEDKEFDLEAKYIEEETRNEEKEKLYKAITLLALKQQIVIKKIFFERKNQEEVAVELNVSQPAISITLGRTIRNLKKILKNF